MTTMAQVTPELVDSAKGLPLSIAGLALAGWAVWLMYRQAEASRKSMVEVNKQNADAAVITAKEHADSFRALAKEVSEMNERPCIRKPGND